MAVGVTLQSADYRAAKADLFGQDARGAIADDWKTQVLATAQNPQPPVAGGEGAGAIPTQPAGPGLPPPQQQDTPDPATTYRNQAAENWANQATALLPKDNTAPSPDLTTGVAAPSQQPASPPAEQPIPSPSSAAPPAVSDFPANPVLTPPKAVQGDWQSVANAQIGKPYIWGSAGGRSDFSPNAAGFDCSGFVSYVYKNALGINLPAQTASAYQATRAISPDQAQPGDIVEFNMDSSDPHQQHIAIYMGNGQVIQAGGTRRDVNIGRVDQFGPGSFQFRRAVGAESPRDNTAARFEVGAGANAASGGGGAVLPASGGVMPDAGNAPPSNPIQGAADAVGQKVQGLTDWLSQLGRDPTDSELSQFLSQVQAGQQAQTHGTVQAAQNLGGGLVEPRGTPFDAITGAIQGFPQARVDAGNAISQAGADSNLPVVGGALQAAGGMIGAPSVLDQIGTIQELNAKYGTPTKSGITLGADSTKMTPEDRYRYENAMMAVGGLVGDTGAKFDKFGVQEGFTPPAAKREAFPETVRPTTGDAAMLEPEIAATLPQPPPALAEDATLQGLINMAKSKGLDTSALEEQIRPSPTGLPPSAAPETTLTRAAVESPNVPPVETPGTPPIEPPGVPPTETDGAPIFPTDAAPSKPVTMLERFNAFHTGNVISGVGTMTHVITNGIIAPIWSYGTRGAGDLATLQFDRFGGRTVGIASALAKSGDDFMSALRNFYTEPSNIANRVATPAEKFAWQAQQATGAAMHSSFQNVAQGAVQRLELGAYAGEQAAQEGLRGSAFANRVAELIDHPDQITNAAAVPRATEVGQRAALRAEGGTLQGVMEGLQKKLPVVGNTLFPVVRIAAQSVAQGVEKSPLGLVGTGIDVARGLAKSGPYAEGFNIPGKAVSPLSDRLTNNIAGTALTAFMASKAMDGAITGNGPADPAAKQLLMSQGWQPHSIYIPGRGFVDYHILGPLATPLAMAGAYADAQLYEQNDASALDRAGAMAHSYSSYLLSTTGLRTLGDLATLMAGGAGAEKLAANFFGNMAGGFVPESGLVKSLTLAADTGPARKPETMGEPGQSTIESFLHGAGQTVEQNLPGLRQNVPYAQDVIGRNQQNPAAGLGMLLPQTGKGDTSPILAAYTAVGVPIPATSKTITRSGAPMQLSLAEQRQYQQIRGQLLEQAAGPIVANPGFTAKPINEQRYILSAVLHAVDQAANAKMLSATSATAAQRFTAGRDAALQKHAPMAPVLTTSVPLKP